MPQRRQGKIGINRNRSVTYENTPMELLLISEAVGRASQQSGNM